MTWYTFNVYDPGKSSGVAYCRFSDVAPLEVYDVATYDQGQMFDEMGHWSEYQDALVMESFTLRGSNEFTANLQGVEIIGAAKFLQATQELSINWRTPAQKSAVPDSTLKALGEWRTGATAGWIVRDPSIRKTGRHVNDAIIHAYGHMISIGHEPTIEKLRKALEND